MTPRNTVINFMSDIKGKTPILLIAKAAKIFKKIYSGRIYNINNLDDISSITNMSISKLTKPVVIEDLSDLYNDEDLLKLIEETNLQFILLAYKDNVSDMLVSRCKSILKIPDIEVKPCKYISEISAFSTIQNEDMTPEQRDLYLAENCPKLMRDLIDVQSVKYKDRLINIIANIEGDKDE